MFVAHFWQILAGYRVALRLLPRYGHPRDRHLEIEAEGETLRDSPYYIYFLK